MVSLHNGAIPEIQKLAAVTPIFKKGFPGNPANYRPVSLSCIGCKLLEVGVKEAVLSHLLTRNLLSKPKYDFLTNKSTTTQLLESSLDWNIALSSRLPTDVIYLDYTKAFDSVVHTKLLYLAGLIIGSYTLSPSQCTFLRVAAADKYRARFLDAGRRP